MSEQSIRRAYTDAVASLARGALSDDVLDAIARGASAAVDELPWQEFAERLRETQPVIQSVVVTGGASAHTAILDVSSTAWRFDRTDPRAVAVAERQAGQLVTHVSDTTRRAVREAVSDALTDQVTPQETARRIQSVVGLHPRHERAVEGLRRRVRAQLLDAGVRSSEADRRAAGESQKLAAKLRSSRGDTISRTELARAQNAGRYLGWVQADEADLVDLGTYGKRWQGAWDACPICSPLIGSIEPAYHVYAHGGEMPPAHPNCRCTATLLPPGRSGWRAPSRPRPATFDPGRLVDNRS